MVELLDEDGPAPQHTPPESVTVGDTVLNWNAREMGAAIVAAAANQLVEATSRDLRAEVIQTTKQEVVMQVALIVSGVLNNPFQPTNEFGEAKGPMVTLRELARTQALNYLGVMVDKDGRPSSYNANQTRLQHIVTKTVEEVFTYQLKSEIKKAVDQAVLEAKAHVGAIVGDLVVRIGGK